MKTCQQSLHDEGGQSRAVKKANAQKLGDVGVAKGAHQLALSHEFARDLGQTSLQDGVDGFGGGGHRESHLVHCAIGPSTDVDPSELNVRENEWPQPWIVAEKAFSHCCFPFWKNIICALATELCRLMRSS